MSKILPSVLDEFCYDYMRTNPLPKTKLVYSPLSPYYDNYAIPELSFTAMEVGLFKWIHPQKGLSPTDYYLLLDMLDINFGHFMPDDMYTLEEAADLLDLTKACGPPYCWICGPTKKDVLDKFTPEELWQHFIDYDQCLSATLKDEIRILGKRARMFTPANIVMVLAGNFLFGRQNDVLQKYRHMTPVKIGMCTPGIEAVDFWEEIIIKIESRVGYPFSFDGAQNDSHDAAILFCIIRDFRKKYLPAEYHKYVDRYYDQTNMFWCLSLQRLFKLVGNPSGQTLTAWDNSFITLLLLYLHAIRHGISPDEFNDMFIAIYGDDLFLIDTTEEKVFHPEVLNETYNSLGMYLECPGPPSCLEENVFIGMHAVYRKYRNFIHRMYSYDSDKLLNSMNFIRKGMSVNDRISKLVSICILLFGDQTAFEFARKITIQYFRDHSSEVSKDAANLIGLTNDVQALNIYCSSESASQNLLSFLGFGGQYIAL